MRATGALLAKCFIYLRKKGGLSAAARYLSAINDARQSATAAFFGGGLDDLDEQHVVSAFRDAFTSTMRKSGRSPSEVLGQLRSGSVEEVEALYAGGRRFLEEKGLGEVPCVLTNGVLTPLSDDYEREVMTALNVEHRALVGMIQRSQLTDDMADIPAAIAKAASAFPRYSKELLLPTESISLAELKPGSPTLASGVVWVGAPMPDAGEPAAADAAARSALAAKEAPRPRRTREAEMAGMMGGYMYDDDEMAGMMDGGGDDDDDDDAGGGISPRAIRSVSHLLVVDLRTATSRPSPARSRRRVVPDGRARLGLLHNPADGGCAARPPRHGTRSRQTRWRRATSSWDARRSRPHGGPRRRRRQGRKDALASALLPASASSSAAAAAAAVAAALRRTVRRGVARAGQGRARS